MTRKRILLAALALVAGVSLAVTFFSVFLQALGGNLLRVLVVFLTLVALFSWGSYRLLADCLTTTWWRLPRKTLLAWMAASLLAGGLLLVSMDMKTLPESIHFFFPSHTLQISLAEGESIEPGEPPVKIRSLSDGPDYLFDLHQFQFDQEWTFEDSQLTSQVANPSTVYWRGSLLNRGQLAFWSEPGAPRIQVTWDGVSQNVDLNADGLYQKVVKLPVDNFIPARYVRALTTMLYWIAFFCFALFLSVFCYCHPMRARTAPARRSAFWVYALPMVAVWGLYLLVFYPGILSPDSIHQWRMASGYEPISDWHPAIHTLLWWLVKQVWNSSAGMALLQIAALSLAAAWGIDGLVEIGLPRWGAWVMSGLFALSPANSTMAITMWKDVFYGISLFTLFLMFFRLTLSQGTWLQGRGRWVAFGLVAAAASLFRHNGLAVVGVLVILALLAFREARRPLWKGTALFVGVWFLVSYPFYSLVGVVRVSSVLRDTIFLHHFGAHVIAGTPLTQEEYDYFNALEPLSRWKYNCCNVSPLYFDPDFDEELFAQNQDKHLRMFLDLAWRDPMVDVRHMICSSSLVWRICNDECGYLGHFIVDRGDHIQWVEPNDYGIAELSLLPGLVTPLARLVIDSDLAPRAYWLWSPAFYLYLGLFAMICFALRRRSWRMLLISAPIVVQSAVMVVATISTDFRYQYSVYLMGLFSVGLVLLMLHRDPTRVEPRSESR